MKTRSWLTLVFALVIVFFSTESTGNSQAKKPDPKAPAKQTAKHEMKVLAKPPACPPVVCVNQESTVNFEIVLLHQPGNKIENDTIHVKNQLYEIDSGGGLITRIEGFDGFTQTPPCLPQPKVELRKPG